MALLLLQNPAFEHRFSQFLDEQRHAVRASENLVHHLLGAIARSILRRCPSSTPSTAMRNCTRDEGGPFEVGNQVLISSHRKLLLSKAMVVNVAEKSGQDYDRQG